MFDVNDKKIILSNLKNEYGKVKIINHPELAKLAIFEMRNRYKHWMIQEYSFCCYVGKIPCWIDVEGEGFGWMWHNFSDEETDEIDYPALKEHAYNYMLTQTENLNYYAIKKGESCFVSFKGLRVKVLYASQKNLYFL